MSRASGIDAEILIAGGGLAGACMANLLIRERRFAPERILIVEPHALPSAPADDVDLRVSAISRASERILRACEIWDRLPPGRVAPYERMCVWDEKGKPDRPGAVRFDCAEINQPNLGHIVENLAMQRALLDRARQAGVRLIASEVIGLELLDQAMAISLRDGPTLQGRLVIAADGARSAARELMGIQTRVRAHEQRAIVTHIRCGQSHRRTAWQRFLRTGPIAALPLLEARRATAAQPGDMDERRSSIVWSTTEVMAQSLMAMSDEAFCAAVQLAFDGALGPVESCARRVDFPLQSAQAEHYVMPRFALIGDAAHAVHPLAGQGVNLGFLDCAALAQVLGDAQAHGGDPGEPKPLRRYERWRKGDNLLMLAALDGLNRLFSNDTASLGALRRAGFDAVDRIGFIKNGFMRRALGLGGDLPRIAAIDAV